MNRETPARTPLRRPERPDRALRDMLYDADGVERYVSTVKTPPCPYQVPFRGIFLPHRENSLKKDNNRSMVLTSHSS